MFVVVAVLWYIPVLLFGVFKLIMSLGVAMSLFYMSLRVLRSVFRQS